MARRRHSRYDDYGWGPYVSVAEKRLKAEKSLKQLQKKNPNMKPVILQGKAIAETWWGKSWNKNLERYADYTNRISRGRSYVRNRAILDLQINRGEVVALVQGTRAKPYNVTIQIDEIAPATWRKLKKECAGKLGSLPELLAGNFPKEIGELFTQKGKGLFPSPRQIEFSCTCPDWASMCKHVAATLFAIGARLDTEPALFFTLRNVEMSDLVSQAVQSKSKELLKKAQKKSTRVIEDADLSAVFGIQLDEGPHIDSTVPLSPSPNFSPVMTTENVKKPVAGKKKVLKESLSKSSKANMSEIVYNIIKANEEGADTIEIKHKTGLEPKKIHPIIAALKKEGKIEAIARGIYIAKL